MRKKRARPVNYRLVTMPGTANQLVLGLSWRAILAEDLERESQEVARRARATHYVHSDARSSSVGLLIAKGRENRAKARSNLYSGAAAFAQMHRHGTHLAACSLSDGSVWIAVVENGAVLSGGDLVLNGKDKAEAAIQEAISRNGDLQIHSDYRADARVFSLPQLAAYTNGQSALRRASLKLSMVSPIWWVMLGLVAAWFAWDWTADWLQEREARLQAEREAQKPDLDAGVLWNRAITAWSSTIKTHGNQGLSALLDMMLHVPVYPGRWILVEVDCQPPAGTCSARYRRPRLADNLTLQAALPSSWKVHYAGLDEARAVWSVRSYVPNRNLALGSIPNTEEMQTVWEPAWQALRPALLDIKLPPATPVPIQVPNVKLPNGLEQPVPLPRGMQLPQMRSLIVDGPLRSLYGLELPTTTVITQLQLRHAPGVVPGLTASEFIVTFKGTLYVLPP